jgi:hypothetical protein
MCQITDSKTQLSFDYGQDLKTALKLVVGYGTKGGIRHVAESTALSLKGGNMLVEIHRLAEQLISPRSRALKGWRLTGQRGSGARHSARASFLFYGFLGVSRR